MVVAGASVFKEAFCVAMRPSSTATHPFKMRKKYRKPSPHAPEMESGKFALRELESSQRPI